VRHLCRAFSPQVKPGASTKACGPGRGSVGPSALDFCSFVPVPDGPRLRATGKDSAAGIRALRCRLPRHGSVALAWSRDTDGQSHCSTRLRRVVRAPAAGASAPAAPRGCVHPTAPSGSRCARFDRVGLFTCTWQPTRPAVNVTLNQYRRQRKFMQVGAVACLDWRTQSCDPPTAHRPGLVASPFASTCAR
jgi:hypothetical protein